MTKKKAEVTTEEGKRYSWHKKICNRGILYRLDNGSIIIVWRFL